MRNEGAVAQSTKDMSNAFGQLLRLAGIVVAGCLAGGCSAFVSSAAGDFADDLAMAVVNQTDPETVRDGIPAYLLLLDSLLEGDPENPQLLGAAAELYSAYGVVFSDSPDRARRLTARAKRYAARGMCVSYDPACSWGSLDFDAFLASLRATDEKLADSLYSFAFSSLAYARTHSDDWNALAELPQMQAMLEHLLNIDDGSRDATLLTYLGVLATIRPQALGGRPAEGLGYFERALALGEGSDLSVKLEIARSYARPLYDRDLHDRLLSEILAADPVYPGLTLTNTLAQREAIELLETADEYF